MNVAIMLKPSPHSPQACACAEGLKWTLLSLPSSTFSLSPLLFSSFSQARRQQEAMVAELYSMAAPFPCSLSMAIGPSTHSYTNKIYLFFLYFFYVHTLIHTLLLTYTASNTSTMARTSTSTSTVRRSRTTSAWSRPGRGVRAHRASRRGRRTSSRRGMLAGGDLSMTRMSALTKGFNQVDDEDERTDEDDERAG